MSLIIGKEIQKLMTGYPTVSDKYDVTGGVLGGSKAAHFGDVLVVAQAQGQSGVYAVPTSTISDLSTVAGVALATNVKLAAAYPGTDASVAYQVGEACNLCFKGCVAVQLFNATESDIKEGALVKIVVSGDNVGKLSTATNTTNTETMPGWVFTGIYENHGTAGSPVIVAEVAMNVK